MKKVDLKNGIIVTIIAIVAFAGLLGCGPSATVIGIEGTGNESPNGSLGMVMLIKNNLEAGNIGVKVSMYVRNFGILRDVKNSDARSVTEALVKGASIVNTARNYSEKQYYYFYSEKEFVKGKNCKIVLYYFVKPDMIDENLAFNYDFSAGDKHIKAKKTIKEVMLSKSFDKDQVQAGSTTINIK
ncbi:MAG: hypothetical protein LBR49_03555 [Tannerella sp.]|nr:hypothetical protein [Tannerella sp.]